MMGLGEEFPRGEVPFISHHIREYMTAHDLHGDVNLDHLVRAVSAVFCTVKKLHLSSSSTFDALAQDSKSSLSSSWGRRDSCPAPAKEILFRILLDRRLLSFSSCS